jgi:hypothetical protein
MSTIEARHAEIARRYARRGKDKANGAPPLAAIRIAELKRLFRHRYGDVLPDDDAGRDDALIMAHHLARRPGDARHHIEVFLAIWAPWATTGEVATVVDAAMQKQLKFRADTLAKKLNLTDAERIKPKIKTIGAVDVGKDERLQRRRERDRHYRLQRRRTQGGKARADYEANALTTTKPWLALGISRATWYRQGRPK